MRIGTFMGRKMIKAMASDSSVLMNGPQKVTVMNNGDVHDMDLHHKEASLDYLCNLSPHRLHLVSVLIPIFIICRF